MNKLDIFIAIQTIEGETASDESETEQIEAWQYLLDTGVVWQLQGWYGRTARDLIKAGIITPITKGLDLT